MLLVWRTQYLRIVRGYKVLPDGMLHFDGFPTTTVLGRIKIDGEGAGQGGTFNQHFAEVYYGDGLVIWRAMQGMPYLPKQVLYAKMLSREPIKEQVKVLGLKTTNYFMLLDNAYYYLAGRIDTEDRKENRPTALRSDESLIK